MKTLAGSPVILWIMECGRYGIRANIVLPAPDMSKPDERIDVSDEPDHNALCEWEPLLPAEGD